VRTPPSSQPSAAPFGRAVASKLDPYGVGRTPLHPCAARATVTQFGTTSLHLGTAGSNPLAPTTYEYSDLLWQHSPEAVT
jgi:hypothetical protein